MQLVFSANADLPALAWAAVVTPEVATIHHGLRLERGEDWCLDGAWPGRFEGGLPNGQVDALFAFILRANDSGIQIDTPSHPLERLHIWRGPKKLIVSPSIPFVLALANADVDSTYPHYGFDFLHLLSGISNNCASIPLAGGQSLEVIANRRVFIANNLETRIAYRPLERSFRDFSEYKETLIRAIEALRDNALSPARRAGSFGLATSISSGYDSMALNILAAPFGWKNAVTFSSPGDTADSGEAAGRKIGLTVHPIERHLYQSLPNLPEAEILATGTPAEDVVFFGAEPVFRNNLVITGTHGGEVWDKNIQGLTAPDIVRVNGTGCGLLEFRWRAGFLHAPIPHVGGMGMMALKVISWSREMEPWRLGVKYDRPIPRRIIEEFGIERGSFASVKIGMISVTFNVPDQRLREIMNPESHAAFLEFYQRERSRRRLGDRCRQAGKYALYRAERFLGHHLHKAGVIDKAPDSFAPRHKLIPSQASFLFPWAVEVMKGRYSAALKDAKRIAN